MKELPKGMMYTPTQLTVGEDIVLPIYDHLCEEEFKPLMNVTFIHHDGISVNVEYYLKFNIDKTLAINAKEDMSFDKLRMIYDIIGSKEIYEGRYDRVVL